MAHNCLKSQDLLLVIHLLADSEFRKQREYAHELGLSQAEISNSLKRLVRARLIDAKLLLPYPPNVLEFLCHGVKYLFPVEPGAVTKGIPTAHSTAPMSSKLRSGGLAYVWPSRGGIVKGQSIEPLYDSVPNIVQSNPNLHQLLALVDSIRLGKPREQRLAISELGHRIQ